MDANNLHHAYVVEGDLRANFLKLLKFLEGDVGFKTRGNPDFWHSTFDTFGIDEARALKEMQEKKAFVEGGKKVFILSLNFITREAQNSLLKVFEEPTSGTHFFLLAPSAEIFLPTVKSRVVVISRDAGDDSRDKNFSDSGENSAGGNLANKFLASSPKERLELLAGIVEEKDKSRAIEFLNNLETELFKTWGADAGKNLDAQKAEIFQQIMTCRNYLHDRAPSVKMLLEHIALVTPTVVS